MVVVVQVTWESDSRRPRHSETSTTKNLDELHEDIDNGHRSLHTTGV